MKIKVEAWRGGSGKNLKAKNNKKNEQEKPVNGQTHPKRDIAMMQNQKEKKESMKLVRKL